jgi:hypothetical protein
LRVINVRAYVKTGAIYAASFGLLIFGLGLISWSFGSDCPPMCPPVPPNPAVGLLGAALIGPQEEGDEYGGPHHSIAETSSPIMTRACEGELGPRFQKNTPETLPQNPCSHHVSAEIKPPSHVSTETSPLAGEKDAGSRVSIVSK